MLLLQEKIQYIETAAARWQDPDYGPRAEAVARTLAVEISFTEEAIAFSVNQRMRMLTAEAMQAWASDAASADAKSTVVIGVLHGGEVPMQGLRDLLAVVLMGHRYLGCAPSGSFHLLAAFIEDLLSDGPEIPAEVVPLDDMLDRVHALMGDEPADEDEREYLAEQLQNTSIPNAAQHMRPATYSVAVLDGQESEEERLDLAEDIWLHEGRGPRSVRLVWAPRGLSPDPYLNAFAEFRAVFPVHDDTPGTLEMARAFLEATDQSHAYGEGLEFLVSRGAPDVQAPGHLRWAEYDEPSDIDAWVNEHKYHIYSLVGTASATAPCTTEVPAFAPGRIHRLDLGEAPGDAERMRFLAGLRA